MKNNDGSVVLCSIVTHPHPLHPLRIKFPKISDKDILNIEKVNQILLDNNQPVLTDEEILAEITKSAKINTVEEPSSEEMQRLAGFEVKKEIIYHKDTK